jgi:hypothetical protein
MEKICGVEVPEAYVVLSALENSKVLFFSSIHFTKS